MIDPSVLSAALVGGVILALFFLVWKHGYDSGKATTRDTPPPSRKDVEGEKIDGEAAEGNKKRVQIERSIASSEPPTIGISSHLGGSDGKDAVEVEWEVPREDEEGEEEEASNFDLEHCDVDAVEPRRAPEGAPGVAVLMDVTALERDTEVISMIEEVHQELQRFSRERILRSPPQLVTRVSLRLVDDGEDGGTIRRRKKGGNAAHGSKDRDADSVQSGRGIGEAGVGGVRDWESGERSSTHSDREEREGGCENVSTLRKAHPAVRRLERASRVFSSDSDFEGSVMAPEERGSIASADKVRQGGGDDVTGTGALQATQHSLYEEKEAASAFPPHIVSHGAEEREGGMSLRSSMPLPRAMLSAESGGGSASSDFSEEVSPLRQCGPQFAPVLRRSASDVVSGAHTRSVGSQQDASRVEMQPGESPRAEDDPFEGGSSAANRSPLHRHRAANSTSTLFLSSTISTPDPTELIRCVSIALHTCAVKGHQQQRPTLLQIYDERLHPIGAAPDTFDKPPTQRVIYRFIAVVYNKLRLCPEAALMMLIYIDRLIRKQNLTLHASNWRRLVVSSLIIATKVWEDAGLWNVDFANAIKGLSVHDVRKLEVHTLNYLEFDVTMRASQYVKYYFKLRAVAETVRSVLPQELLEKSGAARLEQRSVQERDALLREVARKSKSVTLEQRKVRSPLVLS